MTKSEHILMMVEQIGDEKELKKEIDAFLKDDYIPKNSLGYCGSRFPHLDIEEVLAAVAGMRCAQIIGDDIQSGLTYCGRPAHVYGWSKEKSGCYYVFCEKCAKRHRVL